MGTSRRTLKQRAYNEFGEFLIIALYLWVIFGLLELHKSMILAEHHIDFAYHGVAFVNAWALAKVMIVARRLHLGEQFNEAPLNRHFLRLYLLASNFWKMLSSGGFAGSPSIRVLPISAVAHGRVFLLSHCWCSLCSSRSSDTANCEEFLARANWRRSSSTSGHWTSRQAGQFK